MCIRYSLVALCAASFLLVCAPLGAQSASVTCPKGTKVFPAQSSELSGIWKNLTSAPESSVDLSITASGSTSLAADFLLALDLDGDNEQETYVDSRNLGSNGHITFNNAFDFAKPAMLGADAHFALQSSVEGKNTVFHVVFNTGSKSANLVLPKGRHSIVWTVAGADKEPVTCFQSISVQGGSKNTAPTQATPVDAQPNGVKK